LGTSQKTFPPLVSQAGYGTAYKAAVDKTQSFLAKFPVAGWQETRIFSRIEWMTFSARLDILRKPTYSEITNT